MNYLEFKTAKCKDCFKCLRECPVKAIRYENHQAKIIEEKCILCGKCTLVCPQQAKYVHSEIDKLNTLLSGKSEVVCSVAPSFIGSFDCKNFSVFAEALKKLGFSYAEETAVGAKAVTEEYAKLLDSGKYVNLISSACPAINKMLQIYYPSALKYLAPVNSPMLAHAKMLKARFPKAKRVFIGPCIAKKREAEESGIIDAVLTFEELDKLFIEKSIDFSLEPQKNSDFGDRAEYYPINNGIIKSFDALNENYEYITVDGVKRGFDMFEEIDKYKGLFIEVNCCEHACVNGPCIVRREGGAIKADEEVRRFVKNGQGLGIKPETGDIDIKEYREPIGFVNTIPSEREIKAVLAKTGKITPEDELNCGACGYSTCREKAIAVISGAADLEMCLPYMRTRAESMSYEIIQNNPNGIIVMDYDLKIIEYNANAVKILGIDDKDAKGRFAYDCFDATEFMLAENGGVPVTRKRVRYDKSGKYAETTIVLISDHKILFAILKDITDEVEYDKRLSSVKAETLQTTDEVIKKQMRVAQEIASLLGETIAETKVALLKLKKTLIDADEVKKQ